MTLRYIGAMILSIVYLTIKKQPKKVGMTHDTFTPPLHLLLLNAIVYANG